MASFVLVHGAWLGGFCWKEVVARLSREGHSVVAPDLLGHGDDRTPIASISLGAYADAIAEQVRAQPGEVVLVGHSMAGAVISEVAERLPDALKVLVYLAAFLLRPGESVLQASRTDAETGLRPHLRLDEAAGTLSLLPEGFAVALSGCPEGDITATAARSRPVALAPLATPVRLTEGRFGRVRRVFIEATEDQAISPGAQRRMVEATPCASVLRINTGHAPFLQAPEHLTQLLAEVAGS